MFQGSFVAVVTPFRNGAVDYPRIEHLVDFHVRNGTSGIVPCGTTGEAATLSVQEHKEVVAFTVKCAAGRMPVIAGSGSNCTTEAIELTAAAAKAGADACLLISPYYNKPEPEGMFLHFKAVADAAHLPMILYSIPGRTGREIALETVFRLADEVKEVVGIKESDGGGAVNRATEICRRTNLDVLSGDDFLTLPMMSVGARGVISTVGNFIPRDVAGLVRAALAGDLKTAREAHQRMFPLVQAAFLETNPIAIKTAMALLGLCEAEMRLPLSPMRPENATRLKKALRDYGLLK
jgi:4-hydroxy-tetrahydrodipicolinate synthase